MISYQHPKEKETLLNYTGLLGDTLAEEIIARGSLRSKEEAIHLAHFFWNMVARSNIEDKATGESSDYILEKIIITFMAYYRASGYEEVWETISDER